MIDLAHKLGTTKSAAANPCLRRQALGGQSPGHKYFVANLNIYNYSSGHSISKEEWVGVFKFRFWVSINPVLWLSSVSNLSDNQK
jgi:hypothetical protein